MKRSIAWALLLALLLALPAMAAPAPAESAGAEERLAAVTLLVKEALGVSNEYTEFFGDYNEYEGGAYWYLNWYSDTEALSVTADDAGRVYSYDRRFNGDDRSGPTGFQPHFPALTQEKALASANAFLDKVLGENEAAHLEGKVSLRPRYQTYYSGSLTINGLETDVYIDVALRSADGEVLRFYRGDEGVFFSGETPSPEPAFDAAAAIDLYRPAFTAVLDYRMTDYEAKEARLVYSFSGGERLLDANTGLFLDDAGRYAGMGGASAANAADMAAMDSGGSYLTEAEQSGIAKLEGILDAEALRRIVLAEPAFGLTEDCAMSAVQYALTDGGEPVPPLPEPLTGDAAEEEAAEDEQITARFSMTLLVEDYARFGISEDQWKKAQDDGVTPRVLRYFTLDAKTGEILNLYTSYSLGWRGETATDAEPVISELALAFLNARYPDHMAQAAQCEAGTTSWQVPLNSFTYCQQVNGYNYRANAVSVTVNAASGYVDAFDCRWDEDVAFGPADSPVGEAAALDAYLACFKARLGYVSRPAGGTENPYAVFQRCLVYGLEEADGAYVGYVDAMTGEAKVEQPRATDAPLAYDDIAGIYAEDEILALAAYDVGFRSPSFQPRKALTELDMLCFLLSAAGYTVTDEELAEPDTLEWLYSLAQNYSILPGDRREPERVVTRSELAKSLVSMAGFGAAAELKGIYLCGFADDAEIPAADYGYVALAKGLGFVRGDTANRFRPLDGATRQELAVMLHAFMSR